MVTLAQVQNGISRYIESEFLNKLGGWQKWVFGAGATLAMRDLPNTFEKLRQNELVKMMNVIDDAGNIDIDALYANFKDQARKGPITFDVPLIGAVTLNEADVDKIYQSVIS